MYTIWHWRIVCRSLLRLRKGLREYGRQDRAQKARSTCLKPELLKVLSYVTDETYK